MFWAADAPKHYVLRWQSANGLDEMVTQNGVFWATDATKYYVLRWQRANGLDEVVIQDGVFWAADAPIHSLILRIKGGRRKEDRFKRHTEGSTYICCMPVGFRLT